MTTGNVFVGVYLGVLAIVAVLALGTSIAGHHSLRDIGKPCRDHGGVAQFVPASEPLFFNELATVVCRDGKVGRV